MAQLLAGLDLNAWLAIGSAALALISFLFNWAVVARQSAMQYESLRAQMDAGVFAWAESAVDALSEAVALARGRGSVYAEDELRRRAHEAAARLSAIADKGRLFFPNIEDGQHGADKEIAFRGHRPPVLDALIFAYYRLSRMDLRNMAPDEEAVTFLVRCRRLLVSEVQRALDPRRRGRILQRLASAPGRRDRPGFKEAADLGVELEDRFPGLMIEKRDARWIAEMEKRARAVYGRPSRRPP